MFVPQRRSCSLHPAVTAELYIVTKITGDRPVSPGAWHKASSKRTLQAQVFDGDRSRHAQVSYIQSEYEVAGGGKEAARSTRYRY